MSWFDTLLKPIMIVVAWIMVGVHDFLTGLGLGSDSGVTWTLSIVALVVIMRALLIPLFVRQIRSARAMQMLSPELQALQKKYKGRNDPASREAMTRETMELYQKHGTNPFSSCLPILAQSPIFFALFRLLNNLPNIASGKYPTVGPMDRATASSVENAEIFNAPISASFFQPDATTSVKVVTAVLIVAMSLTTFTTQKQLTQKNMPATALQGPMAQQQKMLLYVLPIIFAVSGVNFPIGVLIYWTTTNLWSMGQQFYVIRRNPTPGSEAERMLKERRARKAAKKGIVLEEEAEPEKPRGQRQQPVRKDRARPSGAATSTGGKPAGGKAAGGSPVGGKSSGAGAKGAGAKPAGGKPAGSGAKAPAAKPTGPKARAAKSGDAPAVDGTGSTRPGKAGTSKPTGGTSAGGSKPAGGKPGGSKAGADAVSGAPGTDAPSAGSGATDRGARKPRARQDRPASTAKDGSGETAAPEALGATSPEQDEK